VHPAVEELEGVVDELEDAGEKSESWTKSSKGKSSKGKNLTRVTSNSL
jgi:hypothetical protein